MVNLLNAFSDWACVNIFKLFYLKCEVLAVKPCAIYRKISGIP